MPGWKALSDELDPDVRAFAERLRRLVDRSGLGVTAVAERTGHDRSAWDAYLGGRRPVPRSAVAALAEVTGAEPGDLAAEWERAERAWARSGDREGPPDPDGSRDDRTMQIRRLEPAGASSEEPAGAQSGEPTQAQSGEPTSASSGEPARAQSPEPARAPASAVAAGAPAPPSPSRPRRTLLLYVTGTLGALLVVTAALLLVDLGGTGDGADDRAVTPPSPTAPTAAPSSDLPAGVKCAGPACTGRDPEVMGCGGPLATTVARTRVGAALVEVRHSETCAAAWARISGAVSGDTVTVEVAGVTRRASVPAGADTDAYTPMLAVSAATDATACATLADGADGRVCTAN